MKALRLFGNILVWPLAISKPLDRLHHSRLLRVLRRLVFGLVLVVFWLLVFVLAGGLGPLITHAGAPIAKAFGVPLTVGKCVILPLGGYVRVENLTIANPDAFVSANPDVYGKEPLAKVGLLECDVAMRSLLSREIAVDTLQLTGLRALYAYDLDTTNVDALLAQLRRAVDERFMRDVHASIWQVAATPAEALRLALTTPAWDRSIRKFAAL